jgi:hypothetical protein
VLLAHDKFPNRHAGHSDDWNTDLISIVVLTLLN